jgi:hypothetical protein
MPDLVVNHHTHDVGDACDPGALLRILDELTALVQQVRADELTSQDRAALRRALEALVSLSRLPAGPLAAE